MRIRAPRVPLALIAVGTLSVLSTLSGCTGNSGPTLPDADFFVREGAPFLIRFGQTAGIQTPSTIVLVQLSDVLNDSRCPEDVECPTAGFATVRLAVQTALDVQEVDIDVPPGADVQADVEEVTITVITLRPPAQEGVTIELLDYEIGLAVVETGDLGIPQ